MSDPDGFSYIAKLSCGCVVAAIADYRHDDPQWRKTIAKETGSWIRDGLTVERVSDDYVRQTLFKRCEVCRPTTETAAQSGQLSLFDQETP